MLKPKLPNLFLFSFNYLKEENFKKVAIFFASFLFLFFLFIFMKKQRRLNEQIPSGLEEALEDITNFSKSSSVANRLFERVLSIIQQNRLFIEDLPYIARVAYVPKKGDYSTFAIVEFNRISPDNIYDKIRAMFVSPGKNYGADVTRVFGEIDEIELYRVAPIAMPIPQTQYPALLNTSLTIN